MYVEYFLEYIRLLEDFLYSESKELSVKQYMSIVAETQLMKDYVAILRTYE